MIWCFAGQAFFQLLDALQVSMSLAVVQQLIRCDQASTAEQVSQAHLYACYCQQLRLSGGAGRSAATEGWKDRLIL